MSNALTETVALFEWRLRRLEFLLRQPDSSSSEDTAAATSQDANEHDHSQDKLSIIKRTRRLEKRFDEICSNSKVATDLLKLYEKLEPILESEKGGDEANLTLEQKVPIILAAEESLRSGASQLAMLQEMPFPEAKELAELIALRPRITKAKKVQEEQAQAVEELRARTIGLMARWYESSILEGGREWNEIEQRLMQVELTIKRQEAARAREESQV